MQASRAHTHLEKLRKVGGLFDCSYRTMSCPPEPTSLNSANAQVASQVCLLELAAPSIGGARSADLFLRAVVAHRKLAQGFAQHLIRSVELPGRRAELCCIISLLFAALGSTARAVSRAACE